MSVHRRRVYTKPTTQIKKIHTLQDSVSYVEKQGEVPEHLKDLYRDFVIHLASKDTDVTSKFASSQEWMNRILKIRKIFKCHPRKAQMQKLYEECLQTEAIPDRNLNFENYLQIRASRSLSGILVIAVLMAPHPTYVDKRTGRKKTQKFSCKHNCYYCPNEPGMPRSYLSAEPAVARAVRAEFGAIDQFYARANTLRKLGHDVDKIELLVLGGTFCQFPVDYQEEFMRDLFWSANTFYDGFGDFSKKRARLSLKEEIKIHETATKCRIVGITLETRPDTIRDFETIKRFREYGATRLQIGVQHVDDGVLKHINRGCYHKDTIKAIRLLKNTCYKIDIHLMPNLPGSDPEKDKKMFDTVLGSELLQCDQWKVYPCQTVDHTLIKKWYEEGSYVPYSFEKLLNVIIGLKSKIHPWIRLNRIFRSLPKQTITSGITMSNFRQHLHARMDMLGRKCKCIRCREIGTHIRKGRDIDSNNLNIVLKVRWYKSSQGDEAFLSFESQDGSVLMGFCRLRLPPLYIAPEDRSKCGLESHQCFKDTDIDHAADETKKLAEEYAEMIKVFPELYQAALIREVHVYGHKQNVNKITEEGGFGGAGGLSSEEGSKNISQKNSIRKKQRVTGQSMGYGSRLVTEAEIIAKKRSFARMAIIAGVGTRMFYRLKLGYETNNSYMVKCFETSKVGKRGVNRRALLNSLTAIHCASVICFVVFLLYFLVSLLPIGLVMVLTTAYILWLDYVHYRVGQTTKRDRWSILRLTRMALVIMNLAVFFKWCSYLLPRPDFLAAFGFGGCACKGYWAASLLLYVTGFYCLKMLFLKRVAVTIQNPIFGNDRGVKKIPQAMGSILCSQLCAYTICQVLMIATTSHCTDEGLSAYDRNSPYVCHDQFDSTDIWFALSAITADFVLFGWFANQWNGILSVLLEEVAGTILIQFGLVIIGMLSCVINAGCHYWILLKSDSSENFDSFQGSGYFCLDCALMATLLVAGITDCQIYFAETFDITPMIKYYKKLEEKEYAFSLLA